MFAYSLRTDTPISSKFGILMPRDMEELSSGRSEGGSCSLKTEDRRTVPRLKLTVVKR
jgi:hypothetical protein